MAGKDELLISMLIGSLLKSSGCGLVTIGISPGCRRAVHGNGPPTG
jgi:hypothetical protein